MIIKLAAFLLVVAQSGTSSPPANHASDDASVIRAVIQRTCDQSDGTRDPVTLIADQAILSQDTRGSDLDASAIQDLILRNAKPTPLPMFPACAAVAVASPEEVALAERRFEPVGCPGDDCEMQGAPDRKGILHLSLPGYSSDGSYALVGVTHQCGSVCGWSGFIILRRENGQWLLQFFVPRVVS